MKLISDTQFENHSAASRRGAIEGTLASGSVALAGSYYLHRTMPAYRRLPFSLKALGFVIIVAPCLSIQAERRGLEYDRSQWEGEGVRILSHKEVEDLKRWDSLTTWGKIGDWSSRHEYSIIMGGWAGSLAIAAAIISRQKYQSYAQKIVQARMWAQGLTIGLLIVAGALTQSTRAARAKERQMDHSWQDVLDQQQRDKDEEERLAARIHAAATNNPAAAVLSSARDSA